MTIKLSTSDVPPLACDCHVHVFGPPDLYPPAAARSYTPVEAPLSGWRRFADLTGLQRLVLVQPSAYGHDNTCLVDALRELGSAGRGVAGIDDETSDEALMELDAAGVRGVRLNPKSVGARDIEALRKLIARTAARVAPLGWHVQLYAELGLINELASVLAALPVPVVLDHMGGATAADDQDMMRPLLRLLAEGQCWIKLSAPYRVVPGQTKDFTGSTPIARALVECNASRLVWGSDWPHTAGHAETAASAPPPIAFRSIDPAALLGLLGDAVAGDRTTLRDILVRNPEVLYGFS